MNDAFRMVREAFTPDEHDSDETRKSCEYLLRNMPDSDPAYRATEERG